MNKKIPLWSLILSSAVCILLSVIITLSFCYRFFFLDTKNEYERKISSLSEQLAPREDPEAFRDLPDKAGKLLDLLTQNASLAPESEELNDALLHGLISDFGDPYARYFNKTEYSAFKSAVSKKYAGVSGGQVGEVGYIRLKTMSLTDDALEEYKKLVDDLTAAGIKGLVIDLRGVSDEVVFINTNLEKITENANRRHATLISVHKMLDYLLSDTQNKKSRLLFETIDDHQNAAQYLASDSHEVALPTAVLIDERSEKTAELFALVMRLNAGAQIYGKTGAGNGTIQQLVRLKDGSGLLYTFGKILAFDGTEENSSELTGGVAPDKNVSTAEPLTDPATVSGDPVFAAAVEGFGTGE